MASQLAKIEEAIPNYLKGELCCLLAGVFDTTPQEAKTALNETQREFLLRHFVTAVTESRSFHRMLAEWAIAYLGEPDGPR